MNLAMVLLAVAGSVWTGWWILRIVWPADGTGAGETALRGCLAAGLGWAVSSSHFLIWRAVTTQMGWAYRVVDLLVLPVGAWGVARIVRYGGAGCAFPDARSRLSQPWHTDGRRLIVPLGVATIMVALLAICVSAGQAFAEPLGAWDGWAIWNLKARFLFRGGADWTGMFSRHVWFSHPDYPLLMPAAVARLWTHLGHETTLVPQLTAIACTAMVVALLFFALAQLRGAVAACVGTLLLVSYDAFLIQGGAQYADVLLSFYVLAAVVAVALAARVEVGGGRLFILAGLMVGCAALVKNEGLVIGGALLLGTIIAGRWGGKETWKPAALLLAGMLAPLLIVTAQKVFFAGQSYLVADQPSLSAVLHKAFDPSRHGMILKAFFAGSFGFHLWRPRWRIAIPWPGQPQFYLLAAVPLIWGRRNGPGDRFSFRAIGVMIAVVIAVYYGVLLVMPYSLAVLLDSLPRLELHLWPSVILLVMMATRWQREPAAATAIPAACA